VTIALPTHSKSRLAALLLATALVAGCSGRDSEMAEKVAAANAAAMRAEQAAQRAEHAAANAQRAQPGTTMEVDADPNEDPNAQPSQAPAKAAEAQPDPNTQTVEG
jgi:TPP-dependent 2-oxoacid decarboxylase